MSSLIFVIVIFVLSVDYGKSHSCLSFNNVSMLLYDRNGRKFNQGVNGCITRTEFGNTTVVKAYVKNQIIPTLGRDSVKHMKHLTIVSFNNCALEEILPVAFRNVPKLTTIEMTFGKLKLIPKGIFNSELTPQLELLRIHHNEIDTIEDQSFYNISSLKHVQLNNNKLESWRSEWFDESTSLEIIDFSFNHLREIPSKAFINLKNMKNISFDYNDIMIIHPDAFKEIRTLAYLGLSHNKLTVLSDKSFPNTLRLNYFKINANYLTFLSNKVLQKLAAVEIKIDFNPWTCPCLQRINYWLYIKNGKIKVSDECDGSHIPICVVPNNTQTCLDHFDHEAMLRYINTIKAVNISTPIPLSCVAFQ
ncbi:slit homolog 3 protein-like [Anoplophora glabripennis]|uniref:slit homolog 3 protein-like n=1 Tax=Anoplophora glabripennis TaxID=217634 RepID=UPI0008758D50|nr:slit homolog 3 protein-like [Anoplophora glabripennis]